MALVPRGEDLVGRHPGLPPTATELSEMRHRLPSLGALMVLSWDQVCDGPPMTGYGDALAAFDRPEQLGQLLFGLSGLYFTHRRDSDRLL
jgi:hypothetical protein